MLSNQTDIQLIVPSSLEFEPGVVYSREYCQEVLQIVNEDPEYFLELTHAFAKTVSVEQARQSMIAWDI